MNKTKKAYEEYLNALYPNYDTRMEYLLRRVSGRRVMLSDTARKQLRNGQYGTVLRKHNSCKFNEDFKRWSNLTVTQEQIDNRKSDLVCVECGVQFITDRQRQVGGSVSTFRKAVCCLCGTNTHVTHYRHYNYLQINTL